MKISDLADDPDAARPRSIEEALADLVARNAWRPSPATESIMEIRIADLGLALSS
jgi:predicted transcriptional regulator